MIEPAWKNSTGSILAWHGDCCRDEGAILPQLPANSVSCVVTDPPYDLTAGKRGGTGAASLNTQSPAGRSRIGTGGGFMGQAWDATGVAFDAATWEAVRRVAKPGAMLLAFGGTRTFHRMACAIEDAGWEIRDTLMWVFGSGFPKSLDISKAIDKAAGAERDLGALAAQWRGYGTALKPAYEPIILAMNPLDGTYAANAEQWGVAGLNIDACRIGDHVNTTPPGTDRFNQANFEQGYRPSAYQGNGRDGEASAANRYTENGSTNFAATPGPRGGSPRGRWPTNLIHDGSEEVVSLFPANAPGFSGGGAVDNRKNGNEVIPDFNRKPSAPFIRGDNGSAARFFYCAKASRSERNAGCEDLPKGPLNWSSGEQNPGSFQAEGTDRLANNHHPTVKPLALMRYLCRLVCPPDGIILDPFGGSFSTAVAAIQEHHACWIIEQHRPYFDIGAARVQAEIEKLPLFA